MKIKKSILITKIQFFFITIFLNNIIRGIKEVGVGFKLMGIIVCMKFRILLKE